MQIKTTYVSLLNKECAMTQNSDILTDWFNLFQSLKEKHEIKIKNIYNMNEKRFMQEVINLLLSFKSWFSSMKRRFIWFNVIIKSESYFFFLLNSTLIVSLCEILYNVASVALAQRSFHLWNHFFLRSIL